MGKTRLLGISFALPVLAAAVLGAVLTGCAAGPTVDLCEPNPCKAKHRSVCSFEAGAAKCGCDQGLVERDGGCEFDCASGGCEELKAGVLLEGEWVNGSSALHRFVPEAGMKHRIRGSAGGAYATLELLKPDGTVVKSSSGAGVLQLGLLSRGAELRVRLRGAPSVSAKYQLSVEDLGPDDHGDEPAEASPVTAGTGISGAWQSTNDADVFVLEATALHTYEVLCTAATACQLQASGFPAQALHRLVLLAPTTAPIRITLTGAGGGYQLFIRDFGADDHGGTPSTATLISADGGSVGGVLQSLSDVDYFSFVAVKGHVYRALVEGEDGGRKPLVAFANDAGFPGTNFQVPTAPGYEAPADGPWFVEVKPGLTQTPHRYTLKVSDVGEDDHGDSVAAATVLDAGVTGLAGNFEAIFDRDVFRIPTVPGSTYLFSTASQEIDEMRLLNANGAEVVPGNATQVTWTADAGFVFLWVECKVQTGPYSWNVGVQ